MLAFIKRHPISVSLSIVLHILVVGFFTYQWKDSDAIKVSLTGEKVDSIKEITQVARNEPLEPMKTFAVDSSQVQERLEKIKAEQAQRKLEQQNLKKLTQQEKERLKQLQKKQAAEKAKAEKAKRLAEKEKKKAEAQRKKTEQAKQQAKREKEKAEAARKKAEQANKVAAEAEKRSQQEKEKAKQAEQKRIAEEKKKKELEKELAKKSEEKKALEKAAEDAKREKDRQVAERRLQEQLAKEEAAKRAAQKRRSQRETYISSITAKVKDNWRTPARISPNAQCDLKITQSSKGMITSVNVTNCNKEATRQFQQAAEKAVYRAEPLPAPPVPELFERVITFEFKP